MPKKRDERRSCCPVGCTLDLIGDRWTLLVVRDLFAGKSRFKDFQASPEGIATNILASRLEQLTGDGLVEQYTEGEERRARYRLTERGRSLGTVLKAVADWGLEHIDGTEARVMPV